MLHKTAQQMEQLSQEHQYILNEIYKATEDLSTRTTNPATNRMYTHQLNQLRKELESLNAIPIYRSPRRLTDLELDTSFSGEVICCFIWTGKGNEQRQGGKNIEIIEPLLEEATSVYHELSDNDASRILTDRPNEGSTDVSPSATPTTTSDEGKKTESSLKKANTLKQSARQNKVIMVKTPMTMPQG